MTSKAVDVGHYRQRLKSILQSAINKGVNPPVDFLALCEEICQTKLVGEYNDFSLLFGDIFNDAKGLKISHEDRVKIIVPTMRHIIVQRRIAEKERQVSTQSVQWVEGPRAVGVGGSVPGHRFN